MDPRLLARAKAWDTVARWGITTGGLVVIGAVIAILVLIVQVTLPLFVPASSRQIGRIHLDDTVGTVLGLGLDDYLENGYLIDHRGRVLLVDLKTGEVLDQPLATVTTAPVVALSDEGNHRYTALAGDHTVAGFHLAFTPDYTGDRRVIRARVVPDFHLTLPADREYVRATGRPLAEGGRLVAVLSVDSSFLIHRETVTTDLFGDETRETNDYTLAATDVGRITAFTLTEDGEVLAAGTDQGMVVRWRLTAGGGRLLDTTPVLPEDTAVTSLAMVFGSISLAVGGGDGSLATWMEVPDPAGGPRRLQRIHPLRGHSSPVRTIVPSRRDKSLLSVAAGGAVHWDHMTSENSLLRIIPEQPVRLAALAGRNNGLLLLDKDNTLIAAALSCPHPEVSWRTLFGKVWYESYPEPDYVWQSSAANDDFEPKFSITPLLFGTVKGTLYAMLLAVPLALAGAVYVSQFCRPAVKRAIKPTVEVMASVPSVVIGFLAALWLAPLVEHHLAAIFLAFFLVPAAFLAFIFAWQMASDRFLVIRQLRKGYEFVIVLPVVLAACWAAVRLGPVVERALFGADLKHWLYDTAGITYDQRNCIIIAFALGFTVIPIIFSIAEDALSNVPSSLAAGSLALGASRWQTVWRVMLPSASPGIFAGIMIGFGRAVGETMIVLMATGNTPIMDWSIFNGMRTLSANIAVEIPEAPVGSTLYRVLFLCAVILFAMTFVLNTGAEIIRHHLRKKYMRY